MISVRTAGTKSGSAVPLVMIGVGVFAVLAVTVGIAATVIGFAIPLLAVGAIYAVRRPVVMLATMVTIEVINLAGIVADRAPLPIFHVSLGLGALTIGIALRDPVLRARINRGTVVCIALVAFYLITRLLAAVGSQEVDLSITALQHSVVDCSFLVVILLLTQISGRPWAVAAAVVVPLAVLSLLTVISQYAFGGSVSFGGFATVTEASGELITTLRYGGPLPDSNFWGRHLIMGLPLACALIVRAVRAGQQSAALGWAAALCGILAGVYLTQSRGTFIAAAVALVVWVLASGPVARRRGLMSLPLMLLVPFVPGVGNRLADVIGSLAGSTPSYVIDPSVLGRLAAQQIAWAMFEDRPIFGFGPETYKTFIPRYAGVVHTAVLEPAGAPHNLYAQFAAEGGIVGLIGWAVFVLGFITFIAIRLTRLSGVPATPDRSLSAAVLAALIGWSIASIFLHMAYFRTFAILVALAGALASSAAPDLRAAIRQERAKIRDSLLAAIFGVAAAAIVLTIGTTPTHTASQRVTILPTARMGGDYAYALDIRSRSPVLPTYAAMMAAAPPGGTAGAAPGVMATADPVRGLIVISATDRDENAARAGLETAVQNARGHLAESGADFWYTMGPVGGVEQTAGTTRSLGWVLAALIVGALTAAATVFILRRQWDRRPRHRRMLGRTAPAVDVSA